LSKNDFWKFPQLVIDPTGKPKVPSGGFIFQSLGE